MPSPESPARLGTRERHELACVARRSIAHGLAHGVALAVDPDDYTPALTELRGSFVTLHRARELRGCVGSLEPSDPLVASVARNAYRAAFLDPRFPPLAAPEQADLQLHLSVLGPLQPIGVASRSELAAALRPKLDGLVLVQGALRATFLPTVWDALPEPLDFIEALERKAGLRRDAWARGVECLRYDVEEWTD
jgi:AmmeMemoRadiSam system protein A